jgi:hypothetical protein
VTIFYTIPVAKITVAFHVAGGFVDVFLSASRLVSWRKTELVSKSRAFNPARNA